MPEANVQSISALVDLKSALGRFTGEAQEALQAAGQEIRHAEEWLQERLAHWRNEVQRRQEEVRRAEVALARCQASGHYDRDGRYHVPDCSAYEHALFQAQVRLGEAETELRNVYQWMNVVNEAVATYRIQAQRLSRLLATDLPKAGVFLEHSIADLHSYLAVTRMPSSQPMEGTTQVVDQGSTIMAIEAGTRGEEPELLQDGNIFDKEVKADWLRNTKDVQAGEEAKPKTITKLNGRQGRIDVFVPIDESWAVVVEAKDSHWDIIDLRRNVRRQARQIWGYVNALLDTEDKSQKREYISPGVVFSKRPSDPARVNLIEQLFDEEGIAVVWEDESIAEHKARS